MTTLKNLNLEVSRIGYKQKEGKVEMKNYHSE